MKKLFYLMFAAITITFTQSCNDGSAAVPRPNPEPVCINVPIQPIQPTVSEHLYSPKILPHLEKMVTILESGVVAYNWNNASSCNIGLLAQHINNMSASEIENGLKFYNTKAFKKWEIRNGETSWATEGSWTNKVNYYCGITNKPIKGIVGKLQQAGFTSIDIQNTEYLADPYILSKIGNPLDKKNPSDYTLYMKTWRDIVRKQVNKL